MTMGTFNAKISAEFTPPKTWKLEKQLSFKTHLLTKEDIELLKMMGTNIDDTGNISCNVGMKTDLASVPRAVWGIISPWDVARAAVIHDHLYAVLRTYYDENVRTNKHPKDKKLNKKNWKKARKLSDRIFLWGMQSAQPSVRKYKIYPAYWAVRAFGRWPASDDES